MICHPPRKRGIQYAAAFRFIISASGILDHPHARVMTTGDVAQGGGVRGRVGGLRRRPLRHNKSLAHSATHHDLSSPAKAGDPVRRGFSIHHQRLWNTGSPACADDDDWRCGAGSYSLDMTSRSRGGIRPRFARKLLTLSNQRAQGGRAPDAPDRRVCNGSG